MTKIEQMLTTSETELAYAHGHNWDAQTAALVGIGMALLAQARVMAMAAGQIPLEVPDMPEAFGG